MMRRSVRVPGVGSETRTPGPHLLRREGKRRTSLPVALAEGKRTRGYRCRLPAASEFPPAAQVTQPEHVDAPINVPRACAGLRGALRGCPAYGSAAAEAELIGPRPAA
jgi:hypothetical protein